MDALKEKSARFVRSFSKRVDVEKEDFQIVKELCI